MSRSNPSGPPRGEDMAGFHSEFRVEIGDVSHHFLALAPVEPL